MNPEAYRYPNERLILALTLLGVGALIAFSASVTLCSSALVAALMVGYAYLATRMMHGELMATAKPVTKETSAELAALVDECRARLGAAPVQTFVVPKPVLNAYTFGFSDPKIVVVYAPLLKFLDSDEIKFIVGHELGHVRLGHTWLNSLVGGLAGTPSPMGAAVVLHFAFRWWNRACEFSADRAGLLACGRVDKAISALMCLGTGKPVRSAEQHEKALAALDAQDEDLAELFGEALSTHPLIIRRIQALRQYAASPDGQKLLQQMAKHNLNRADF